MADFPTAGILDTFTRANEGPPPSANWTTGIFGGTPGLKVLSNLCAGDTVTADGYWNPGIFGPDSEVYCTITTISGVNFVDLYLRLVNVGPTSTLDGYFADIYAAGTWSIFRYDNSLSTQIATVAASITNNDTAGVAAIGSTLVLFRNNAPILFTTDAIYNAAGNIALKHSHTTIRSKDFGGGNSTYDASSLGVGNIALDKFPKPILSVPEEVTA